MAEIRLHQVVKRFGAVEVVKGVDLAIRDGEFLVLLGPSGCGKTTVLRMIAGLERPTSGQIQIGDRVVNDVPPKDRDIAMVFQNYALYPHMTVFDNMAYGLRRRRIGSAEIQERIRFSSQLLEIAHLLQRLPARMSGGQRQRVAVGRAIVRQPRAYLMDEPLSNLDFRLRLQTREELAELHRKLHVTTVYVTHDQEEAMTLGHRVVIMSEGVIQQVGTPAEVYSRPRNLFVAGFVGNPGMNLLAARFCEADGRIYLDTAGFRVPVPEHVLGRAKLSEPNGYQIGLRPEDLALLPTGDVGPLVPVKAELNGQEHLGSHTLTVFYVDGRRYLARTSGGGRGRLSLARGRSAPGESAGLLWSLPHVPARAAEPVPRTLAAGRPPARSLRGVYGSSGHGLDPTASRRGRRPAVAAVHGYVLGSGLEMSLFCDLRIAAEDAVFGLPEVGVGFIPPAGGTQILPRVVGQGLAAHMILTRERLGAREALARGLVSRVVPGPRIAIEMAGSDVNGDSDVLPCP